LLDFGGAASGVPVFAGDTVHTTGTEGLRKTIQSAQVGVFLAQAVKRGDGDMEDSVPCLTGHAQALFLPSSTSVLLLAFLFIAFLVQELSVL
jgi:hypothetical protein